MPRPVILTFAALVALLPAIDVQAQSMKFDAVIPVVFNGTTIDGCLHNGLPRTPVVASVSMGAGAVGLTLRFPTLQFQRNFYANPACPQTRSLSPPDANFSLPRLGPNVHYQLEINRGGMTDILGTGAVGIGYVLLRVHFCAEDNAPGCTYSLTVTNRVIVQISYQFSKSSPSSSLGFNGYYLGPPNPSECPLQGLTNIDLFPYSAEVISDALRLESISMSSPRERPRLLLEHGFLDPPKVDTVLDLRIALLQLKVHQQTKSTPARTSGYRSSAYQAHFRDIIERKVELTAAIRRDASLASRCQVLVGAVNEELARHEIAHDRNGVYKVAKPGTSNHERGLAIDLAVTALSSYDPRVQPGPLDRLARDFDLARGTDGDPVHFIKRETPVSEAWLRYYIASPVAVLITDPQGKRVGIDPTTGELVNDLGSLAYHSGADTEPTVIDIFQPVVGEYRLTAIGTGSGPYRITATKMTEHAEQEITRIDGQANDGVAIAPIRTPLVDLAVPVEAPGFQLILNDRVYAAGQSLVLTAALRPLASPLAVDAYVLVELPTGQFLSLQLGGALVPGVVPIARGFVPFAYDATIAQYRFTGAEPTGNYRWHAFLTEPGTMNLVSPTHHAVFVLQ